MLKLNFIKKHKAKLKQKAAAKAKKTIIKSNIIPRPQHNISRDDISPNALKVLYRLNKAGFAAYLVGGGVRDLLVGLHPKDFDVVTDAEPQQIQQLFTNCRLIGRRFRLAHIYFGQEIIEVSTFRGVSNDNEQIKYSEHGMILRDNVYGTIEEDALRRDFTINALYYNIADFSVVDFTSGMPDMKKGILRMIGDPIARYHEDPVRMLRALRIAAKLGFKIDAAASKPITKLSGLLQNVPNARLFDEIIKWFRSGKSLEAFELLKEYGLFPNLFPQVEAHLTGENSKITNAMLKYGFKNTDKRIADGKPLNNAFLFAVLLWWPLQKQIEYYKKEASCHEFRAFNLAMADVLNKQRMHIMMPHRLLLTIREIWTLQYRLEQRLQKKIYRVFFNPRFRAAYDFLLLRAQAGETQVQEAAKWWTKFQEADDNKRKNMTNVLEKE